jgi:hypothetical protein
MIIPICTRDYRFTASCIKRCHAKRSREAVQLCVTVWWSVAEPAARINSKNGGPRRGPIWIHLRRTPLLLDLFEARGSCITLIPQVPLSLHQRLGMIEPLRGSEAIRD